MSYRDNNRDNGFTNVFIKPIQQYFVGWLGVLVIVGIFNFLAYGNVLGH
jgi:hypothetical protein